MGRVERNPHQRRRNRFSNRHAVVGDVCRKLRSRLSFTGLRQDKIGIRVGLYVEVDNQAAAGVAGGVQRVHVIHVVHAVHLLLDRRGHRLLQRLRVRPHVRGDDLNFRWSDIGKLGDRQSQDGKRTNQHHDNRNHHGHNRAIDEKF